MTATIVYRDGDLIAKLPAYENKRTQLVYHHRVRDSRWPRWSFTRTAIVDGEETDMGVITAKITNSKGGSGTSKLPASLATYLNSRTMAGTPGSGKMFSAGVKQELSMRSFTSQVEDWLGLTMDPLAAVVAMETVFAKLDLAVQHVEACARQHGSLRGKDDVLAHVNAYLAELSRATP